MCDSFQDFLDLFKQSGIVNVIADLYADPDYANGPKLNYFSEKNTFKY